jgi:hypothetical protein
MVGSAFQLRIGITVAESGRTRFDPFGFTLTGSMPIRSFTGFTKPLFAAQILLRRLHEHMPKQKNWTVPIHRRHHRTGRMICAGRAARVLACPILRLHVELCQTTFSVIPSPASRVKN